VREHCGIGRSRACDYIAYADGKKTVGEDNAQSERAHAAGLSAVEQNSGQDDPLRKSLYDFLKQDGPLTDEQMQDQIKSCSL
jgi:hypothetical protein